MGYVPTNYLLQKYIKQSLRLYKKKSVREQACAVGSLVHGGYYKCNRCTYYYTNECTLHRYMNLGIDTK